jgi:Fur family ferric uptake transcriptional regulator
MTDYEEILKRHGIRATANRISVLKAIDSAGFPVTLTDIETMLETIDKSNISRALSVFKSGHLLHEVNDGSNRYELCRAEDLDEEDGDLHVHFKCEKCGKTVCLTDCPVPFVKIPEEYEVKSMNFVINGICPKCRKKCADKR